jgi:hypothetical protein
MPGLEVIQGRCRFSEGDDQSIALVAELLETLNSCSRRVFSRSISHALATKSLTDAWGIKAVDLYSKKENLTEFQNFELDSDFKSEESKTKKTKRRGPQQSMRSSLSSSESNLARALGSDRRLWAGKLAVLRKSLAKGKLVQREDDSALEAGQAAKASKGTRVPMKEKKRGMRPASTLL